MSVAASASEIHLTLPDGSVRSYASGTTGLQVAESIGTGLAKAAVGMLINGQQRDLYLPIHENARISILTVKTPEGLDILRHTLTAQVLALAVKELYPAAKLAIGPTIEHGFYYDVDIDPALTTEDLPAIEAKMREILTRPLAVTREMWNRAEAIALFEQRGEHYKAELIRGAAEDDTTEHGKISLYRQGEGADAFIDLCRGPHVPHLSKITLAFRLTRVAGAYWRGDSKNRMLTRIYGLAFADEKALKAHLTMLEEAEKRDHRKLGRELDLFHFQEEAPGSVFWHPKGWTLFQNLIAYMRKRQEEAGYVEINTPDIMDRSLWEASGHWEKFGENMFTTEAKEDRIYALKPMNCPGGVQVFKQGIRSYRNLPLRLAEFGKVHRFEPSGALHGLMRVRAFTQDDAHIFCTEAQIVQECKDVCALILSIYRDFGFEDVRIKFSDRPEKRIGSDAVWDISERALREAVEASGLEYSYNPGEGAFYGPKLEFVLRDAIGRDWQCGTLQFDMNLPERLGASFVGEDGNKHRPIMLHRALFGSLERFTGILIEHYAGNFPAWLAPVQAVVCSITNEHDIYAMEVEAKLKKAGIRTETDFSNNKINYKVREHSLQKIPFILAVGGRDAEVGTVAIRRFGSEKQEVLALEAAIALLSSECRAPTA